MRDLISVSDQTFAFDFGRNTRTPRPPRGDSIWYAEGVTVRKVDENSTAVTVTNSGSETTIATMTLPALTLSSTGAARLTAAGTISCSTTVGEYTFRVKMADASSTATVLATSSIAFSTSTSARAWTLGTVVLGKQPSVNRVWGGMDVSQAGSGASLLPTTYSSVGFSTLGLDETDEWTVSVTAQMSAASTALSVTMQAAVLEAIN